MAISDNDPEQDLIKEILPDITESEHEQIKEILGSDFESWSSVKQSFIKDWNSGIERPVKVVPSEVGIQDTVGGYFTEEKWILGRTTSEMEDGLGFAKGYLKNGATIYELEDISNEDQFEIRGYTNQLPENKSGDKSKFQRGKGEGQFELNEPVKARVIGEIKGDEVWKGEVPLKNKGTEQPPSSNEGTGESEEYYQGYGY